MPQHGKHTMREEITLREMEIRDYEKVHRLWMEIHGFGIRSIDDSKEGIGRFMERNPHISVVACDGEEIVGTILCGHDGRTGCFYHVCVKESYRKQGIGHAMAVWCMRALQAEGINKVSLIAYTSNETGNAFWHRVGWVERDDVNYYDFVLNDRNITRFNA